MMKTKTKTKN